MHNISCFQLFFVKCSYPISFGLFNRRTINCLSREKSDTSILKYLRLKINELSSKLRRLHRISLPFIARFEKFSSYACDVHPKFAHLEAYKYYLFSALSSEASKFFLILYRSYKENPNRWKRLYSNLNHPCQLKKKGYKDRILDNSIAVWQLQKYALSLWRELSTLCLKILKLKSRFLLAVKCPFLLSSDE